MLCHKDDSYWVYEYGKSYWVPPAHSGGKDTGDNFKHFMDPDSRCATQYHATMPSPSTYHLLTAHYQPNQPGVLACYIHGAATHLSGPGLLRPWLVTSKLTSIPRMVRSALARYATFSHATHYQQRYIHVYIHTYIHTYAACHGLSACSPVRLFVHLHQVWCDWTVPGLHNV